MDDSEPMEMARIVNKEDNRNEDEFINVDEINEEIILKEEEKQRRTQDEIFETPIIKKIKKLKKKDLVEEDIVEDDSVEENIIEEVVEEKEYNEGDVRDDGKIYFNGKFKTQPQINHLNRMREKRLEKKKIKTESIIKTDSVIKPKIKTKQYHYVNNINEDVLEKVAVKAVEQYKKLKKEKKAKQVIEANMAYVENEKLKTNIKTNQVVNSKINNTIKYTDEENEWAECFF